MMEAQEIIKIVFDNQDPRLAEMGKRISQLYTDHGLPIDMALERIPLDRDSKAVVLSHAQAWLVEHKRNSGATEASIERQRKANRRAMQRFLDGKDVSID